MSEHGSWIRRYHPGTEEAARLVCFPHAGGSASFYHPLSAALAPHIETLAVQYPGRQDRRAEPPVATIPELADRACAALEPWLDRPLALFGHSMGALVAYEVARRLQNRTGLPPTVLFASGRRAPSIHRPETVHLLDDEGVLEELRKLSGTDPSLLGDEELLRLILPAIRADYAALQAYRSTGGAALACPIVALVGDSDPVTSVQEAAAWNEFTTGPFELEVYPGGHFFLSEHRAEITSLISDGLKSRT